eukprot:snap_masked-scaffold97_size377342-processed-gene-0.1 protein:Tk12109 transcript:snap_masked-scaffold97_size377342-processed-gene-0.1-mRNA-1 annotation:"yeats domain containing protein 4"
MAALIPAFPSQALPERLYGRRLTTEPMSDLGDGSGGGARVKGVTVVKPIVYGNVSKHFGKKRESDSHTHEWTVYLKAYQNEDISNYVKKVQFKLHESYANPNRIVFKPPYEVSETGWGEFEVQIKIHFNDANERPITFYHMLKLFHTGADPNTTTALVQGRKTVVSENYDEIIFQEPTQYINTLLTTTRCITLNAYKHETNFDEKRDKTMDSIKGGRAKVQEEITELKDKLELAKATLAQFKAELDKVSKEKGEDMVF